MIPLHFDDARTPLHYRTENLLGKALLRWTALGVLLFSSFWLFSTYRSLPLDFADQQPAVIPSTSPPSHSRPYFQGYGPRPPPPPPPLGTESSTWDIRKDQVRDAYLHALYGYRKHAFPHDELLSVSGGASDKFNGWGVTLLDSLDTMWIMGLQEEFSEALGFVAAQRFESNRYEFTPFFETTIRYVGGLLSAYALSGEPILLSRADDLGRKLLPVFNTSSGFPAFSVHVDSGMRGMGWMGNMLLFSEIASCQLEFKYLAKLTGRAEYYENVENVMGKLYQLNISDGLFADRWSSSGEPLGTHFTVGASADSGYEYLLKQWLLSGDTKARNQYLKSIDGIINNLLYVTANRQLLYVTDTNQGSSMHGLEHLSCFLPGLLALGAHTLELPPSIRERHKWAAHGLAYTCWISYADQASGLGPDGVRMQKGDKWVDALQQWETDGRKGVPPGLTEVPVEKDSDKRDYMSGSSVYLLRPETVESIYLLWKTTGDVKWRERGYEIFEAIEKHTKTSFGYASIREVDTDTPIKIDDMPSYFLAETLKYLFLLFDDMSPLSLDSWVFNTEAHPFPIFEWTEWEQQAYKITSA